MVTTVTNNSPQAINTSLFSLQKEIDDLRRQIDQINNKNVAELAKGLVSDDSGFITSSDSITGNAATATFATTAGKASNGTFGLLGGAKQAVSDNFEDLLNNELCSNQSGGLSGGSIGVGGQEAKNLGIPAHMWYNFLYIPHRTGLSNPGDDNHMYGTLFVTPMTNNSNEFYVIHRIAGHNYNAFTYTGS